MEVLGNKTDPAVHMKIQYWGGWGYRSKCTQVIDMIENEVPNKFQYHLQKDTTITGNFEVSIYKAADLSDQPTEVFSKKKEGKFPHVDEDTFTAFFEQAQKCL